MESLADPYRCLIEIIASMESGNGLRFALRQFIENDQSEYAGALARWIVLFEQGQSGHEEEILSRNSFRSALMSVITAGLQGEPVFHRLNELKTELHQASIDEIEEKLRTLPIKMLVPLLLFQFPAFLLLLFGPILQQLKSALS